jgi:hypothetical protein
MHIAQFQNIKAEDFLKLVEFGDGFFYLEDTKGHDAMFILEGYVSHVRVCPDNDKFRFGIL